MKSSKSKAKEVKTRTPRSDDFIINIKLQPLASQTGKKSSKKSEKVLMTGSGSWLSHLVIDNETCWRIEEPVP